MQTYQVSRYFFFALKKIHCHQIDSVQFHSYLSRKLHKMTVLKITIQFKKLYKNIHHSMQSTPPPDTLFNIKRMKLVENHSVMLCVCFLCNTFFLYSLLLVWFNISHSQQEEKHLIRSNGSEITKLNTKPPPMICMLRIHIYYIRIKKGKNEKMSMQSLVRIIHHTSCFIGQPKPAEKICKKNVPNWLPSAPHLLSLGRCFRNHVTIYRCLSFSLKINGEIFPGALQTRRAPAKRVGQTSEQTTTT